ncbi:hypothetical protein TNCV_1691721 [Trichonephila clavipes]|nr:hypothetical protein TNCV_1691721 [Trichonephila clavipes]
MSRSQMNFLSRAIPLLDKFNTHPPLLRRVFNDTITGTVWQEKMAEGCNASNEIVQENQVGRILVAFKENGIPFIFVVVAIHFSLLFLTPPQAKTEWYVLLERKEKKLPELRQVWTSRCTPFVGCNLEYQIGDSTNFFLFGFHPNLEGEHPVDWQGPPTFLTRGLAARRLFSVPPCHKGTKRLQTCMPSRGFEPSPTAQQSASPAILPVG